MTGIVVGVDGSEGAARALQWAVREAELRHEDLTAVMAWGWFAQHHLETEPAFDPAYDDAAALRTLDAFVERTLGPEGRTIVERRVINELSAEALLLSSTDADLLVVGARGLGGFTSMLLGSVSQKCLHHARGPIAIVRPVTEGGQRAASERIVVGIDGSETSRRALRWAVDEARFRQAALEVVHAWQTPCVSGYPYPIVIDPAPFEDRARQVVDVALAEQDTSGLPQPVHRAVVSGGGASCVLQVAMGADLVVVGSRGMGGFKGLLLGSVSTQVAHHAPCPVVVVPPGEGDG